MSTDAEPLAAELPDPDPRVVTVDDGGRVVGTAPRLVAHQAGGIRHLAVSVVVVDRAGRVLLQRRAPAKPLFAGLWSNTVCTHPLPGELPSDAALRRLDEELRVSCPLEAVGSFTYEALDPVSGLWENELDHVFLGRSDHQPTPDPDEVSEVRWVHLDDLLVEIDRHPERFSPWLRPVLAAAGLERSLPSPGTPAADPARTEDPT